MSSTIGRRDAPRSAARPPVHARRAASSGAGDPSPIEVRAIGFVLGALVAGLFVGGVLGVDAVMAEAPAAPGLAVPILVAGAAGGWLLAPMAWISHRRRDWFATIFVLAAVAVAIGDGVIVGSLLPADPAGYVPPAIGLFLVGLVVVGWIALPFTLAASTIWAIVLWWLRGRLVRAGTS